MNITKVIARIFILTMPLYACTMDSSKKPGDKLFIVTTTGMIEDAVKNIGGEFVDVTALMGPGVDPHLFKASHGDLDKLTSADVILYNGLHLEGKMGQVLEKLGRVKKVVAITAALPHNKLRKIPGYEQTHDPHIWFNVSLWREALETVTNTLIDADSAHAHYYLANSKRYADNLDSLHQAVKNKINDIPEGQRILITAHDAFGYFGDAYDIEVRGLQGISTISEFGLRDVTELVNFIISRKIKAIFVETSMSSKSIEAVLEGCNKKGWKVENGGNLYSDAMGTLGTPEGTYIGMVNANVNTIVNALK